MSFGSTSTEKPSSDLKNDIQLAFPPDDAISSLAWSPVASNLAVASWDKKVRVYNVPPNSTGTGVAALDFEGPVLSCDWSRDGRIIAGAGTDHTARLLDLGGNGAQAQQVAVHEAPIRSMKFFELPSTRDQLLVTGSWDKTLKYWDLRSPTPIGSLSTHEKVYSMDVKEGMIVIATAERGIHVVDLKNPTNIWKSPDCPLRHQIRVVNCFSDGLGFAVGGIEGRVGMIWTGQKDAAKNYSFKYPRQTLKTGSTSVSEVYGVNAASFHPTLKHIFSTAGTDGHFHFWDRDAHTRAKAFPSVGAPIGATAFSSDGTLFAYGVGYDWSKGFAYSDVGGGNKVMLHRVLDAEVRSAKVGRR